jgi:hypothetical protein
VSELVTAEAMTKYGLNRLRMANMDLLLGIASVVAAADVAELNTGGMRAGLTAASWGELVHRVNLRWYQPAVGNRGGNPELSLVEFAPVMQRMAGEFERAVNVLEAVAAKQEEGR